MKITIDIDKASELSSKDGISDRASLLEALQKEGIKITEETVRRYKSGKVPMAIKAIYTIANITGLRIDEFITIEKIGK